MIPAKAVMLAGVTRYFFILVHVIFPLFDLGSMSIIMQNSISLSLSSGLLWWQS
jgi:hypothetical protein